MKRTISIFSALLLFAAMTLCSCTDESYAQPGVEFLNSAFSSSQSTAESMLSDDISVGWDDSKLSPKERKQKFMKGIASIKQALPGNVSNFKFHSGFTYSGWHDGATGYYSYGSEKKYIIVLEFEKKMDKWKIDGLEVVEPAELVTMFKSAVESLEECKKNSDKDMVSAAKSNVKSIKKIIESFSDFLSSEQMAEYNKLK